MTAAEEVTSQDVAAPVTGVRWPLLRQALPWRLLMFVAFAPLVEQLA